MFITSHDIGNLIESSARALNLFNQPHCCDNLASSSAAFLSFFLFFFFVVVAEQGLHAGGAYCPYRQDFASQTADFCPQSGNMFSTRARPVLLQMLVLNDLQSVIDMHMYVLFISFCFPYFISFFCSFVVDLFLFLTWCW